MSALAKILFFSFHSLSEIIDKKVLVLFFFVPKSPKEHFVIQKLNSKKKKKKKKRATFLSAVNWLPVYKTLRSSYIALLTCSLPSKTFCT